MDIHNSSAFTRRAFLGRGLTLASAAVAVPSFLQNTAFGLAHPLLGLTSMAGVPEDHVLVVIQLGGGNDGLNTVIPYADPLYYKARPGIGVAKDKVLKLNKNGYVGLHPSMTALNSLYDEGLVGIVQGVGYPNPNRSHFKSMDIWHTADTSGTGNGWIGRYVDSECCGYGAGESGQAPQTEPTPQSVIAIGGEAPLATQGQKSKPVAFQNADLFRWTGKEVHKSLEEPYEKITRQGIVEGVDGESNAGFLMRTALDAQISSDQIRAAVSKQPLVNYPQGNDLARQLQMVAAMIRAGLKTRVYYVSMGGYDTHSGQGGENGRHSQLLGQFSSAVKAFYDDLKKQENDQRVLTMSFSEFGRRVYQNASQGTDHGTASQMFLIGPMVQAGVLNDHPSLSNLDNGDLKFTTDFRRVYAGILEGWLKADSKKILEGTYNAIPVVKKA